MTDTLDFAPTPPAESHTLKCTHTDHKLPCILLHLSLPLPLSIFFVLLLPAPQVFSNLAAHFQSLHPLQSSRTLVILLGFFAPWPSILLAWPIPSLEHMSLIIHSAHLLYDPVLRSLGRDWHKGKCPGNFAPLRWQTMAMPSLLFNSLHVVSSSLRPMDCSTPGFCPSPSPRVCSNAFCAA